LKEDKGTRLLGFPAAAGGLAEETIPLDVDL